MNATVTHAIVLAGEREGGNALARSLGISAGILASVGGRSCIERVLSTLRRSRHIEGGIVAGPEAGVRQREAVFEALLAAGDFTWHPPARGPAASTLAACEALARFPVLITTADHALLTPAIVDEFCADALGVDADLVVGLVAFDDVRAAFPHSRRTRIRFSDGDWCGSNLFLARTPRAAAVFRFWRQLEDARKQPWRMAARLGFLPLLRYLLRRLSTGEAFAVLSRRADATIRPLRVRHPRAAVDVDSPADLELAQEVVAND